MYFQKWLSHLINYFSTPSVYVKHVCFVDFQKYVIVINFAFYTVCIIWKLFSFYLLDFKHHRIYFNVFGFIYRFNISMPIYVNMVRDPIERVISWYYYVRAPWYFVERKRAFPDLPLPNPNWLRKVTKLFKHLICHCRYSTI